ncbi:MAG: hypothetical protein WCI04_06070 [archaeon]
MKILIVAEKKKQVKPYLEAFANRGIDATYLRVSKITLVSKTNKTTIKSLGEEIPIYDAVFIQTRTSLAPFIEPLLEELETLNSYVTTKKGSYYIGWNEAYQFVTLALAQIPTPKTITTASAKNIEKVSKKISYPVSVKTFLGKNAQQSQIIHSASELNSFVRSIKTDIDAFLIREFFEGDVISSAVIGNKLFSVKRKYMEDKVTEIRNGLFYKLSEHDHETVVHAAKACGYDIARVDIVKGHVIKVDPLIELEDFNLACSDNIEEYVAEFLTDKATKHAHKPKASADFLGIRKFLQKTPLKDVFK